MPFRVDAEGIEPSESIYQPLPDGIYNFIIEEAVEGKTKTGYDMVKVTASVLDHPLYLGQRVFHVVTIKKRGEKGAGIAIHFLKTIGEPWEKQFDVDASKWINKRFTGTVGRREYNGKTYNQINSVIPYSKLDTQVKQDEDPF